MTDALRYEITHCWPSNGDIAFVKRSPHVCQPLGECPCISVLDEIAIITLPEKHEHEMAEIVRRSNCFDELVATLEMLADEKGWTGSSASIPIKASDIAKAALAKARGES